MELLNNVFLPMLAGHLIADFWLQPWSWVLQKKQKGLKSGAMFLHCIIAAVLPVVFTFQLNLWWFAPVIFVTHILIDFFKSKIKDSIPAFLTDQLLHIAVLCILAVYGTKTEISDGAVLFWLYANGFILITSPLGILTGKMLGLILSNKEKTFRLDVSGWIGIMERILILIFITTGHFSAIGFLIAAKSVFRFNDTREDGNKKAEYFLLGTLISFTLAIVTGLLIKYIIRI
ncbi:MAG: DUF3307 domain-containing protein [Prolixibacteraceae bacterium]